MIDLIFLKVVKLQNMKPGPDVERGKENANRPIEKAKS